MPISAARCPRVRSLEAFGVGIAFVIVGTAAMARAQVEPGAVTEPTAEERRLSAILLDRSAVAYRLGRYEEAVVMLEDAYVLSQEPILLYNLGRAYEGAEDAEHALNAYRRYLETSVDIPNADAVRATIATLEARIEAERVAAVEVAERARVEEIRREVEAQRAEREALAQAQRAQEAERARQERARQERESRAPWPWVIAGTGAATVVAGVVVGALALERRDQAARESVQTSAARALADAHTLADGANVAFVIGGVLVLGGVSWGIVELTQPGGERAASVEVSPTLGGLSVHGTF